ncbi:MAG: MurR/RpiR family transcriptional regulator [Aerococcus sp.]|nr:MurR/RpiR family transcriptional regulator [Aerococcus sp.]
MTTLSPTEAYLWDYIENHQQTVVNASITQLSTEANVSPATIVRTMKKKGFNGYTDFRHDLLKRIGDTAPFSILDQVDDQIKRVIMQNQIEVHNTLENLKVSVIEDSVQLLAKAEIVLVFARGLSESIASEITLKLQLLGKYAEFFNDPNIIQTIAGQISPNAVVIIVTLNGETPELVAAANILASRDIPQIILTTNNEAPIVRYADTLFVGYKSKTAYFDKYEVASRLPLQVMSRILLDSYVVRKKEQ